jgi:hypothetical protein
MARKPARTNCSLAVPPLCFGDGPGQTCLGALGFPPRCGRRAYPNCATVAAKLPRCSRWMATIRLKLRPNAVFPLTLVREGTLGATSMTFEHQALHPNEPVRIFSPFLLPFSSSASFFEDLALRLAPFRRASGPQAKFSSELLFSLSAVTLAWWRCHRRDSTSPRRIGRRI